MRLLAMLLFTLSNSAFASSASHNNYVLKLDWSKNGKSIFSPQILVQSGKKGTVSQKTENEEPFIEVLASEIKHQGQNRLLMNFTLGYIQKNGKRTIVSQPKMMTRENESGLMTFTKKDGSEFSLSAEFSKKSL